MGALDGIRVIDFGHYASGPHAAVMLADQGAATEAALERETCEAWVVRRRKAELSAHPVVPTEELMRDRASLHAGSACRST